MSPTNKKEEEGRHQEVFKRSSGFGAQLEASPQLKSLEFELLLLQKRCEELGKEREWLKKEIGDMKKKPNGGGGGDLLQKVQELTEHNDRLAKDNTKLVKVAKKLEQKAEERKKNLKKLFELMAEKEKELGFYKNNYNKSTDASPQVVKKLEDSIQNTSNELLKRYEMIARSVQDKEQVLRNLEESISRVLPHVLNYRSSQGFNENKNASREDLIMLDQRKQKINEMITQINLIPISQASKVRDVLSFLKSEKDVITEKIKSNLTPLYIN